MYRNDDIDYLKYLRNKEIIIFGAGEKGKKECTRFLRDGYSIVALCDNNPQIQGKELFGKKILSLDELCNINNHNIMIVICSNYEKEIKMQMLERNIYNFISVSQIDFGGGEEYYDEQYFEWQREMGRFGGKIKSDMFSRIFRRT